MAKIINKFFKEIKCAYRDMDKVLFFVTIFLFIFGLANILTASSREAVVVNGVSMTYYFTKQLIIIIGAYIVAHIVMIIPTKKYYRVALLAFVAINGFLLYLALFGDEVNGAKNWLPLPFVNFAIQPSEIAKLIVIVCLALIFEKTYNFLKNQNSDFNKKLKIYACIVFAFILPMIFIFLQKDFGTMAVIGIVSITMFLTSPIIPKDKIRLIIYIIFLGVASCLIFYSAKGYLLSPAQMSRIESFWKPCNSYESGGYQVCNCFIAINNGGLLGVGPGESTQKYSYIPAPHTDSVFAIFAEEYGVLLSGVLFIAYILVIKRIINISINATTIRGRYISLGIATYLFAHILINLGGILGIMPLTGIPLPFLSYAGTYVMTLIIAIAIVERIHIETKNAKIEIK